MYQGNYENILDKISRISGLEKEEIDRRVLAKRAKLSNLISKEGAAQIVAAELGISFDKEKLKISELLPGMKKVNVIGKVIELFPVRKFNRNNRQGKVASMVIADDTSNTRVVLWDTNHIALIEKGNIKQGDVIEILNANMRDTEIHLNSFSDLKLSSENIENIKTEIILKEKKILEFRGNDNIKTRAFIVQVFEPRFFEVCPECKKRVVNSECEQHGKVVHEKRVLLNFVLDDGTETIRSVLFNEQLENLGMKTEDTNSFMDKREELLGKELFFSGNVRKNKLFNNIEFYINSIKEVNIDELIKELEKS